MIFDDILSTTKQVLANHSETVQSLEWLLINRDLNGRVRLIVPESAQDDAAADDSVLKNLFSALADALAPHAYPADAMILYEQDQALACEGASVFPLEGFDNVQVADRLATESDWSRIEPESSGAPRVVFYSIKGGVGRSTALAVTAWSQAQAGKRVLVLDLDLESPGLSSNLLPEDKRPAFGVTDWLVEDLVGNADTVLEDMVATSDLSHDGEIFVVPAHGKEPGDYLAKLGRVWMPKHGGERGRESWTQRLRNLLDELEKRCRPDIILIDSRSGIDEVASSCVTALGAELILLFALEGEQTWSGYRILFNHWLKTGVAEQIRERLQLVGPMIPETDGKEYFQSLTEHGWDLFASLYDEVPPGATTEELWNYEADDDSAPHYPKPIRWHRGFAALASLHGHLQQIDPQDVQLVYGEFLEGVDTLTGPGERQDG